MNFMSKILAEQGFISKEPPKTWREIAGQAGGSVDRPAYYDDYVDAYSTGWAFSCIDRIAKSSLAAPLVTVKDVSKVGKAKVVNLTRAFLAENKVKVPYLVKPNPFMSTSFLVQMTMIHLDTQGNSYWELVREDEKDVNSPIKEIYPLFPNRIQVVPHKTKYIIGYNHMVAGEVVPLRVEDVLHIKYPHPTDDFYGFSPMQAAKLATETNVLSGRWTRNFFKNSASPSGVLTTSQPLSDPSYRRLKREWDDAYRGVEKSHRIAILERGLDFKKIELSPEEAEFAAVNKLTRDEVMAIYGTPPVMLGLEGINRSVGELQKRVFWMSTMIPRFTIITDAINLDLFTLDSEKQYSDVLAVFDTTHIPELLDDVPDRVTKHTKYFMSGVMTPNEIREEEGLPPADSPHADEYYLLKSLVKANDLGKEVEEPGGVGDPGDISGGDNEEKPENEPSSEQESLTYLLSDNKNGKAEIIDFLTNVRDEFRSISQFIS